MYMKNTEGSLAKGTIRHADMTQKTNRRHAADSITAERQGQAVLTHLIIDLPRPPRLCGL